MRTRESAVWLARLSLLEPFRQTQVLTTRRFVTYLTARDVRISADNLGHLASCGLLLPVAVRARTPLRSRRHPPTHADDRWRIYADVGKRVRTAEMRRYAPPLAREPELLWHPFQIWQVDQVLRSLTAPVNISPLTVLRGADEYGRFAQRLLRAHDPVPRLAEMHQEVRWREFESVFSALIAVEPLVVTEITGQVRLSAFSDDQDALGEFRAWCEQFDPRALLKGTGVTVELLRAWHAKLATWAQLVDPADNWRVIIRYAPREKRLRLKRDALLAEDAYYMAEVIRRYLMRFHDVDDLPDEDRIISGPQVERVKEDWYGRRTTTDGDRSVFRHVSREFGLDPQPRVRWLVEGATEEGFIGRWAELTGFGLERAGVEVLELPSGSDIDTGRIRALLELSRQEEVFVVVTVDGDRSRRRVEQLRRSARLGLLPAGWTLFDPDFEEGNFTIEELAEAATLLAVEAGCEGVEITAQHIADARLPMVSIGKTIERLLESKHCYQGKGVGWGRSLAEVASRRRDPYELPVLKAFRLAVRGVQSNYRFTREYMAVQEDGSVGTESP